MKKLVELQAELKAPKNQDNLFGKYKYRNCEDILEAVKPLLAKHKLLLTIEDEVVCIGSNNPVTFIKKEVKDVWENKKKIQKEFESTCVSGEQRFYIKATATITDEDDENSEIIRVSAFAREEQTKKGMDGAQVTGASSSYARKYALNGLFLIDDTKDADSQPPVKTQPAKTAQKTTPVQQKATQPAQTPQKTKTIADAVNATNVKLIKMNWSKYVKLSGNSANEETFKALLHSKYKQINPANLTNVQAKEFIQNLISKNKQLEAAEASHGVTPEQANEMVKDFNVNE